LPRKQKPVVEKVVRHPLDRVEAAVAYCARVALEVRNGLHILDHFVVLVQPRRARHGRDREE